jgi:hypothetical protein
MEMKTATTALLDTDICSISNQASITSEDIKRLNQQYYDRLNAMSKEKLIRLIMGDECYYNRHLNYYYDI